MQRIPHPTIHPGPQRSGRTLRSWLAALVVTAAVATPAVVAPGGVARAGSLDTGVDGDPMELQFSVDGTRRRVAVLLGYPDRPSDRPGGDIVDVAIDWGDGTPLQMVDSPNFYGHTYAGAVPDGTKTVKIWPRFSDEGGRDAGPWLTLYGAATGVDDNSFAWAALGIDGPDDDEPDVARLTAVLDFGALGIESLSNAFNRHHGLVSLPNSLPPGVTDLAYMFKRATAMNDGSIANWDMTSVTNTHAMFEDAASFNQPLANWERTGSTMANITRMDHMFEEALAFNQPIAGWNVSGVTNMGDMFESAESFNQSLAGWDVSKVTDLSDMFEDALAFNGDVSSWDVSNVTTMASLFDGASAFNGDVSSWDVSSVTNMNSIFQDAKAFTGDVSSWDVSSVTNMFDMFNGASAFNQDVSSWDVSNVTNMNNMFEGAIIFNADVSSWDVSNVTTMADMFYGASAFDQDVSSWDVSNVTDMANMFHDALAFDQDLGGWTLNSGVGLANMLDGSGMSVNCYDATLIGWAALDPAVTGRSLGADGRSRTDRSEAAYTTLDGARGWTITDGGDGGVPAGPCSVPEVTSAASPTPSGPRVDVVTAPTAPGDPVVGEVSGGDAGIDIWWRLVGPDGATLREGPVTLDDSGAGTITTTLPSAATGGYRLELVAWGAEDSFTLGLSDGPVPTGVPAGAGPGDDRAALLVIPVLLALAVLLRRRAWTV